MNRKELYTWLENNYPKIFVGVNEYYIQEAEEALHNAVRVVLRKMEREGTEETGITEPLPYFRRVMRSRFRDNYNTRAEEESFSEFAHGGEFHEVSPEEQHIRQDEVDDALSVLTPHQKEVYLLYNVEGLNHQQIAEKYGVSRVAITQLLQKITNKLSAGYNVTPTSTSTYEGSIHPVLMWWMVGSFCAQKYDA